MVNTAESCSIDTTDDCKIVVHLQIDRLPGRTDVNDINCCLTVPQVTLERLQLTLRCAPSPDRQSSSAVTQDKIAPKQRAAKGRQASQFGARSTDEISGLLLGLVDGAIRSLISRKPPRLAAGIRRSASFGSSLQATFPAIFTPACLQAISTRTQLLPSILQSLQSYRYRENAEDRAHVDAVTESDIRDRLAVKPAHETHASSAFQCRIWSTMVADSAAIQPAPTLRTIKSSSLKVGLTEKHNDSHSCRAFSSLDNDQGYETRAHDDDLSGTPVAVRGIPAGQALFNSMPDFEENLLEVSILEEAFFEQHPHNATLGVASSGQLPDELLGDLQLLGHQPCKRCSSQDSVSILDYPLKNAAFRSADAESGHALMLMDEGFLHGDTIGCEDLPALPTSAIIGQGVQLSQRATRCSPLTSYLGMTEHERQGGTPINASHPHEDLLDSHIAHYTPVDRHNSLPNHILQQSLYSQQHDGQLDPSTELISDQFIVFDHDKIHIQSQTGELLVVADDIMPSLQKPAPLHIRTEAHRPDYFDSRSASKRSSTTSNLSAMSISPSTKSSRGGKLLRHLSRKSKDSDEDILSFDPSSYIGTRSVEIKRRKTSDDYDMIDRHHNEEEDEMLFQ